MPKIHEDYYLRKQLFANNDVPALSTIKLKIGKRLSEYYFSEMNHKLKVWAGIEPKIEGCSGNWCMKPEDILKGKHVLKPTTKQFIANMSYKKVYCITEKLLAREKYQRISKSERIIAENSDRWKEIIIRKCEKKEQAIAIKLDTSKLETDIGLKHFEYILLNAIKQIEMILKETAHNALELYREETMNKLKKEYKTLLEKQSKKLYNKYERFFEKKRNNIKSDFIKHLEMNRRNTLEIVHDVKVDKHKAIDNMRQFHECKNLACQLYVAMLEKEEHALAQQELENAHIKKMAKLNNKIKRVNEEIPKVCESETKQNEIYKTNLENIAKVIRKIQEFVSYSLHLIPEHSAFFVNMEDLMLIQLNESLEKSNTGSIIEVTEEDKIKPCIIGKDNLDLNKKINMPAFIINKHCICSACDNLKDLAKLKHLLEDAHSTPEINDLGTNSRSKPVKWSSEHKIKELTLESSIMQILQNEINYLERSSIPNICSNCKYRYCKCSGCINMMSNKTFHRIYQSTSCIKQKTLKSHHLCELKNTHCKYPITMKEQLCKSLPPYMLKASPFVEVKELTNYITCSSEELRMIAEEYRCRRVDSKDVSCQYSDFLFEFIHTDYCNQKFNSEPIHISRHAPDCDSSCTLLNHTESLMANSLKVLVSSRTLPLSKSVDPLTLKLL